MAMGYVVQHKIKKVVGRVQVSDHLVGEGIGWLVGWLAFLWFVACVMSVLVCSFILYVTLVVHIGCGSSWTHDTIILDLTR